MGMSLSHCNGHYTVISFLGCLSCKISAEGRLRVRLRLNYLSRFESFSVIFSFLMVWQLIPAFSSSFPTVIPDTVLYLHISVKKFVTVSFMNTVLLFLKLFFLPLGMY